MSSHLSIRAMTVPFGAAVLSLLVCPVPAAFGAADLLLKKETLAAWDEHIDAAKRRMQDRLRPNRHFLWIDEDAERSRRVYKGEIIAAPVDKARNPRSVPSGLIHNWVGAAFFPNAAIQDVFAVVGDYQRYKDIYKPAVIDSKVLSRSGEDARFKLLLQNKSHFVRTAFDGEYASTDVQVDATRWYSLSQTTKIQEIQRFGQAGEHKLPAGEGSGLIWRLFSVTRFEARDGGVYVELEAIALSRTVPGSLHWLADPIIRRVAKSSLVTSLEQTGGAVRTMVSSSTARERGGPRPAGGKGSGAAIEAAGGHRPGPRTAGSN